MIGGGVLAMWSMVGLALAADGDALERARAPVEHVSPVEAPEMVLAGATVWTAAGEILAPGWVAVADGRITALGAGAPPADLPGRRLDLDGMHLTPGLIDTHSHLGVYPSPGARAHSDGNEMTSPTTAEVWAEHSVWPQDPGFQRAMAGGVTTLLVLPGSANLVGGRGVTLRAVPTRGSRAMRFPDAPETVKMACGEYPKRVYGEKGGPATRMGNVAGHREAFVEAAAYQRKWAQHRDAHAKWEAKRDAHEAATTARARKDAPAPGDPPEPPARDLAKETLAGVLTGEVLAQIHCYRADDMLSMLQVADEFGFSVRSFHHALEAYKIADLLAERGIAVSTWADWWGFKMEAYDGIQTNAGLVSAAGGRAVIHSDSGIGIQRLNQEASKARTAARAAGLDVSADEALRWITVNPAWTLGIDDQVGSLSPGLRADLVVWDADPLSVYARARLVFVDGALRYDAARPQTWSDFEIGQEVGR